MSSKKSMSAREVKLAEARKKAQSAERRRSLLLAGAAAVVIALIAGTVGYAIVSERDDRRAAGDLSGVKTFDYTGGNHVEGKIDYKESPPVGGEHNGVWLNCGTYDTPVPDEHAVHSLEHGAVWIGYDPDLPEADVKKLDDALPDTYTILSPYEGKMPGKIVLSAWSNQLSVDSADDPRIKGFIKEYRQGKQTPEPGAACTGGVTPETSLVK
ncbi:MULTISPECIES: DUF3105 domain-containing protein [Janibacter]|jgi:ABC-type amino acid transport substrate-binding protein|uniref:DUF3105 domain-containing protein n=2 Tax=Janibacter TaxID=53457 RepID=A0A1L3MK50_9MICO|nr:MULTISPECIES: DUF3105 domain-containing protein [Janibacter]MDN5717596.1 DUF3105 domain-containing protein [Janibacter sp.]APH02737.1 hypothetical protein ASJ30_15290 [Janibacter indicus]QBF47730.1 DUF3105 domain-containing protein [Janibacter limosus]QNF94108.1 DUF3105 domain-containing protein [Janibacter sp. YB324]QOK22707.1 DUF3105 domain-containing protein [Janibacter indicus]